MTDYVGGTGNDSFPGTSGDDTFLNGGGKDTLQGGDGNDTFTFDAQPATGSIVDGGADTDTLVFQNLAGAPTSASSLFPAGITTSSINFLNPSVTLSSFEAVTFNSAAGTAIQLVLAFGGSGAPFNPSQVGGGLAANATITGGAGLDSIALVANYQTTFTASYALTAPSFTYVDWTTPDRAYQAADRITVVHNGNTPGTITGAAHSGVMNLIGGMGSDTITGSDDMDYLAMVSPAFNIGTGAMLADYGANELHGGGGNDALALVNIYATRLVSGLATPSAPTFMTGAGSTFDGGDGTDFLVLGGSVEFLGTVDSIEGIYLAPAYANAAPAVGATFSQAYTHAVLGGETITDMPANLILDGVGTLEISLAADVDYDFSGFVFEPGSNVSVEIFASDENLSQTIIGTSHGDVINFGAGNETVTGGGGADRFQIDEMGGLLTTAHNAVITDFVIGEDKIDLDETGAILFSRINDFLSQGPDGALFSLTTGGQTYTVTLQGVDLADLSESDFLLDQSEDTQFPVFDADSGFADVHMGGSQADSLVGGDGNDTIYTGGGADTVQGGNDDDTVIFDGPVPVFQQGVPFDIGSYDGGLGFDTIVLRDSGLSTVNPQGIPVSGYSLTEVFAITGFEELRFDSEAGRGLGAFFLYFIGTNPPGGAAINLTIPVQPNITGGEGQDFEVLIAINGMGSLAELLLPVLNMNDWTGASKTYLNDGDYVTLQANDGATPFNYALRANDTNGAAGMVQVLLSGNGDDTLTGSVGRDWLEARGGNNVVDAGDGDDAIAIINSAPSTAGTPVPTTYDGAGSTYEGGAGNDFLVIGGVVNFAGTLSGIEGVYLQPEYALNNGYGSQVRAQLTISVTELAKLGPNARFDGVGDVIVNVLPGEYLDASGYVFEAGSDVTLVINGSSNDEGITGTSNGDSINGGSGNDFLQGADGNDTIDGGDGSDNAAYMLPAGTTGTLRLVAGAVAGTVAIERVDGGTVEQLFLITPAGPGSATVEGLNSAAHFGTDTVSNIENVYVWIDTSPADPGPGQSIGVPLTLYVPAVVDEFAHVNGSVGDDLIDLDALYPGEPSTTNLNTFGSFGDDTIVGTAGGNYVAGEGGDDSIEGGAGFDTAAFVLPKGTPGGLQFASGPSGSMLVQLVHPDTTVETIYLVTKSGGTVTVQGQNSRSVDGTDTITDAESLHFAIDTWPADPAPGQSISLNIATSIAGNVANGSELNDVLDVATLFPGALDTQRFDVNGNGGDDSVTGHDGQNALTGGEGNDTLSGLGGNDTLNGGNGNDELNGGAGNDSILGVSGDDSLNGGDGNDTLNGGLGNDTIDGGTGTDRVVYANVLSSEYTITHVAGSGTWTVTDINLANGDDGTDTIVNAEIIAFADGTVLDAMTLAYQTGGDDPYTAPDGTQRYIGGLDGADSLTGGAGVDFIAGGAGNDTLHTGGGTDTLSGGDGDDSLVLDTPLAVGQVVALNGGAGSDTAVLRNYAGAPLNPDGLLFSSHNLGVPGSVETVVFESLTGTALGASLVLAFPGLPVLLPVPGAYVGGDGADKLSFNALSMGGQAELSIPTIALSNWTSASKTYLGAYEGDTVSLVGFGNLNFALRANDTLGTNGIIQVLFAQGGNDTLNGSAGRDILYHTGGNDQLLGNDGDDALVIANGTPTGGVLSTLTGAGSTFDGGAGNDFLSVGGVVNFAGTLSGIEGIYLQPEFALNNGSFGSQARAQLTISVTELAKLGPNAHFDGVGDIFVNLQPGESLDTSGYVFEAGSDVNLVLSGVSLDGDSGNNTLTGTGADDTISTGGGRDTVSAGDGNDEVILNGTVSGGSNINGDAGSDTLVVQNLPGAPIQYSYLAPGGWEVSVTNVIGSAISGFETIEFRSNAGTNLQLLNVNGQVAGGTTLLGGDGHDTLLTIVNPVASGSPPLYTFNAPTYTYSNWDTPDRAYQVADVVAFAIQGSANGTINGSVHAGVQALLGGAGNDTINGTSGVDLLGGGAGNNELHGGGGNDALSLMNNYQVTNTDGVIGQTAETTFTGAGSLFDGGAGQDFMLFGGNVNFQGTMQSIEGIYLAPGYTNPAPTSNGQSLQQNYTWLTIDNAIFQTLPNALEVDGIGTIHVEIDPGTSFNGSQIVFTPGSDVRFLLEGSDGSDIITGTSGEDTFEGGLGTDFLTGGAGNDMFRPSYNTDIVTDFTQGEDRVDLSGLNFTSLAQALPFLTQSGADVLFSYIHNGIINKLRLNGINLADLTEDDFLFAAPGTPLDIDPTENADVILGGTGNDSILGLGGNDTIQSGGGRDTINGGDGDDVIIINAPPAGGSSYDGGAGTDTLVLKTAASVDIPGVGPLILTQTTSTTNFEKLKFDTDVGSLNRALFNYGQLSGVSTIEGGAGTDAVIINAGNSGGYTLQAFTTTNFTPGQDFFLLGNVNATGSLILSVADHASPYVAILQGGTQADTLNGSNGSDALFGNGGEDYLDASLGNDTLNGGAGNDTLDGGAGTDSMLGGTGDDTYVIDSVSDQIVEYAGEGIDLVTSSTLSVINAASYGETERVSYTGTANASLYGNDHDNTITGGSGNDQLVGGLGNDVLDGGTGADSMNGGIGNDYFVVEDAGDRVSEAVGEGNDTVESSLGGFDLLNYVNVENLVSTYASGANLRGNYANNLIIGGDGNDTIDGLAGADTMNGGAGDDTYTVDNAGDVINETSGIDTVIAKVAWTLGAGQDRLVMQYAGNGTGNGDANTITGGGGSDSIFGLDGDDVLVGGAGGDTLDGGTGADTMQGGAGADIYIVDNAGDVVDETGGSGIDLVNASIASYALTAGVERLTFTGSGDFYGSGNDLANTITGGAGNDTLDGGLGSDSLIGGLGDDTYVVDSSTDRISDTGGIDTVLATAGSFTLSGTLENLTYAGTGDFIGTGSNSANVVTGGIGNDSLNGGAGNDTVIGGTGNDTLLGGAGNDSLSGGDNTDLVIGGLGKDTLTGGLGSDTFRFETATDSRVGANADLITDFIAGTDRIDVSVIDPNATLAGDQSFAFIGTASFVAGNGIAEVRYFTSGGNTTINFDNDDNGTADMSIVLAGVHVLSATDFVL